MGIHGLTLYLRENKRTLAKSFEYPPSSTPRASIVVDGWSFIYALFHRSNLPWVYGGEYQEFENIVLTVVQAWISVGLKVYMVFDGAMPELKFQTAASRLTQSYVQPSLLFFRTSPASRSTPRFLYESRIIPPLVYATCINALRTLLEKTDALEIHYADEEGDPYAVELAGRVRAFVVGNDSDFVVLNSEGYLGYVPLEDMVWNVQNASLDNEDQNEEDDGEFQTVTRKSKAKKATRDLRLSGRGLIPPDGISSGLILSFIVYKPSELAARLKLPVALLPLLGALVGNDFSNLASQRSPQSLFFQKQLTLSQRINLVATTLNSILSTSTQKRKPKYQIGSVMDLIDKAVDALLIPSRSTIGSGEVNNIITSVVDATLQYAVPKYEGETQGPAGLWPTQVCALHEPDVCPLLPLLSRFLLSSEFSEDESEERAMREEVRELYLRAYRAGWLSSKIMHVLSTGTSWPRLFLENPDLETVARSIGRPIRQWGYAILEDGVGLPKKPGENAQFGDEEEDNSVVEENDDDELIDVVEEDSEAESLDDGVGGDPLAFLRGELERLRKPDGGEAPEPPKSLSSSRASRTPPSKTIMEYVRRGTRVTGEEVTVPFIADLLSPLSATNFDSQNDIPLQLRSEDDRLTVFLHALGSNTSSIKSLPSEQLMIALVLRWVVRTVSDRARSGGGVKNREKERWTKTEARAFLASFRWIPAPDHMTNSTLSTTEDLPPIVDRNIQLMAQVLMAFNSITDLSHILLLPERVPGRSHLLSGKIFHSFLTGVKTLAAADIPEGLWNACVEGLEDAYGEELAKRVKKGAKAKTIPAVNPAKGVLYQGALRGGGLFGLLGDAEA